METAPQFHTENRAKGWPWSAAPRDGGQEWGTGMPRLGPVQGTNHNGTCSYPHSPSSPSALTIPIQGSNIVTLSSALCSYPSMTLDTWPQLMGTWDEVKQERFGLFGIGRRGPCSRCCARARSSHAAAWHMGVLSNHTFVAILWHGEIAKWFWSIRKQTSASISYVLGCWVGLLGFFKVH